MKNLKKTLAIILCALLAVTVLLTGCGQSGADNAKSESTEAPTEADESALVYNPSSDSAQNTLTLEEGKTYKFESFEFELDGVQGEGTDPIDEHTPEGKWACVRLKIVGGSGDGSTLDRLTDDGNILLNGSLPVVHKLTQDLVGGQLGDYTVEIYYDAAKRYDVDNAVITCAPAVTEIDAEAEED